MYKYSRKKLLHRLNAREYTAKKMKYSDVFYLVLIAMIGAGVYSKISTVIDYAAEPINVNAVEGFTSPLPSLNIPTLTITPKPTYSYEPTPTTSAMIEEVVAKRATVNVVADDRVSRLQAYLEAKNSPLAPYAGYIVAKADEHDIGWTKSVAISAMESDYGKAIKHGSHNAWGIMAFDNGKRTGIRQFKTWEEAISYHAALLGNNYKRNEIKAIQVKYCPSYECNPKWVDHVLLVSNTILEK